MMNYVWVDIDWDQKIRDFQGTSAFSFFHFSKMVSPIVALGGDLSMLKQLLFSCLMLGANS